MLKRKIEKELERFLNNQEKNALMITGARQVGKTCSILDFAKKNYKNVLAINFLNEPEAKEIFQNAANSNDVLRRLTMFAGKHLSKQGTLVFLDEVQVCPEAVTYIKFLVQEGSYRYILSGSLLGVELKNVRSFPVGFMDEICMYPLDFEEFLWAYNQEEDTVNYLRDCFENCKIVDSFIHTRMMRLFNLYLVTGGMPMPIRKHLETNDLYEVTREQQKICNEYRRDITQYCSGNTLRIKEIYDSLPSQLSRENKRFIFNKVLGGSHFDRLEDDFLWLKGAGVALPAYCLEELKPPLEMARKRNLFKFYFNDVGLLASQYMEGIQLKILNGECTMNFGAIYENFVAQELLSHGHKLNYYHSKRLGELDFVLEKEGRVIPVEVKSGKDYARHSALGKILSMQEYNISKALVLYNGNVLQKDKITYLPIYMAMFLKPLGMPEKLIYKI